MRNNVGLFPLSPVLSSLGVHLSCKLIPSLFLPPSSSLSSIIIISSCEIFSVRFCFFLSAICVLPSSACCLSHVVSFSSGKKESEMVLLVLRVHDFPKWWISDTYTGWMAGQSGIRLKVWRKKHLFDLCYWKVFPLIPLLSMEGLREIKIILSLFVMSLFIAHLPLMISLWVPFSRALHLPRGYGKEKRVDMEMMEWCCQPWDEKSDSLRIWCLPSSSSIPFPLTRLFLQNNEIFLQSSH